jgi:DMSO/TMAO reductase YedYZ molybdopterin-dependent catalytic subunit
MSTPNDPTIQRSKGSQSNNGVKDEPTSLAAHVSPGRFAPFSLDRWNVGTLGVDKPSRREALARIASASAGLAASYLDRLAAEQPCADPATAGTLIDTLPLSRAGAPVQPYGVKFGGRGLDARLVTDLSRLEPDRLITPNDLAFVRTECPPAVAQHRGPWRIRTSGMLAREGSLTADELLKSARPMGAHLCECSGNNNPANFGLMSVAEWDGVPLTDVLSRLEIAATATGVLVGGVDPDTRSSAGSTAGASWVIPLAQLDRLGAFFAVRMNGEPLPLDHGRPVRLVVPGWYGCAWTKWVNEIRLVAADEPATSQMKEFAGRTHQTARHDVARDYAPADIQAAALPVRIEKRQTATGIHYRIVGIVWGGTRPIDRLAIRFDRAEPWTSFAICPAPATPAIWSLWEYRWKPAKPGVYRIFLRVVDSSVLQRRLDTGYYVRQVRIAEV